MAEGRQTRLRSGAVKSEINHRLPAYGSRIAPGSKIRYCLSFREER